MFSVLYVCLSPESYATITHDALDPTVQGSSQCHRPRNRTLQYRNPQPSPPPLRRWDLTVFGPPPLLVISGGHHWSTLQICSLQDHPPTGAEIWWLLKQLKSLQGGHTYPTGMLSCFFLKILWKTLTCSFFRNLAKKSWHTEVEILLPLLNSIAGVE